MGTDLRFVARRMITSDDRDVINAYNTLVKQGYSVPKEMWDDVGRIVGQELVEGEIYTLGNGVVESRIDVEGNPMSFYGAIVKLSELPPGTVAIRVYAW